MTGSRRPRRTERVPGLLVAVLPAGIDPAGPSRRIGRTVRSTRFHPAPGQDTEVIDEIGTWLSFDALAPGYSVRGDPSIAYAAEPATALVVSRNLGSVEADRPFGLLVLEHHNRTGDRAHVVHLPRERSGA